MDYGYLKENLEQVRSNIKTACENCGRNPDDITLIAVTKTYEADVMNASIEYGVTDIGENKVQEITRKFDDVTVGVKWHLIGHLQTNKVKYIIDKVHLIHSVDSMKLAEEISKRAGNAGITAHILVQINVAGEESKFGTDRETALDLVKHMAALPNIRIMGLMNIAPFDVEPEALRPNFREMKEIFDEIAKMTYDSIEMKYLSMGMSNDYTVAIEEGANMIRIGTSIYGKRDYSK